MLILASQQLVTMIVLVYRRRIYRQVRQSVSTVSMVGVAGMICTDNEVTEVWYGNGMFHTTYALVASTAVCGLLCNLCRAVFVVKNEYNITNYNFFKVDVTSLDVVMNFDQRILATETNSTRLTMPMRSSMTHYISMNATFTFDEDFIVYASWLD